MPEQFLRRTHQIASQALHLLVRMVDQRLKVPFEMRPAPLGPADLPVHLGPVAVHHAVEVLREQLDEDRGGPRTSQREHRIGAGDERPQPRLLPGFLRRRFVDPQHWFGRQLGREFFVGRRQRGRRLILQLDHPTRGTGLIQDLFQEQGHAPFALFEAAHEQGHQRDQPRSGGALGHPRRKLSARGCATAGTGQAVTLIFDHQRLDLRQVPDLVPQRRRILSRQFVSATATRGGPAGHHVLAFATGDQRPLVFGVPRLAATGLLRTLPGGPLGLGVRMFRTGRQGRIAGRFPRAGQFRFQRGHLRVEPLDLGLQVRDLPRIMVDHRLQQRPELGRQAGQLLRRDRQRRHGGDVADFRRRAKANPPRSLPWGVNGYWRDQYRVPVPVESELWTPSTSPAPLWLNATPTYVLLAFELVQQGKLLSELPWRQFEQLIAQLLEGDGWQVTLTQATRDGGVDVLATKLDQALGEIRTAWQAKKYGPKNKVKLAEVRELSAVREELRASKALVVTTSHLTRDALAWVRRDIYRLGYKEHDDLLRWIRGSVLGKDLTPG